MMYNDIIFIQRIGENCIEATGKFDFNDGSVYLGNNFCSTAIGYGLAGAFYICSITIFSGLVDAFLLFDILSEESSGTCRSGYI